MSRLLPLLLLVAACAHSPEVPPVSDTKSDPKDDQYVWLEDVTGEEALTWVRARNAVAEKSLGTDPGFEKRRARILAILDSTDKIPFVAQRGEHWYNFWTDAQHQRGLWRRTTPAEYVKADTKWELLLDLDALNKAEKENWVWHGSDCLRPAKGPWKHALVSLSRGGADADTTREFDLTTRSFVPNGFERPEAKGTLGWIDENSVYATTDFGPGSLTTSGYPRIVKEWKRGTPMSAAALVYEGKDTDLAVGAGRDHTKGFERDFVHRSIAFYANEVFLRDGGKLTRIDAPNSANKSAHREWATFELREPWEVNGTTYPAGALLVTKLDDYLAGKRDFVTVFAPTDTTSLAGFTWTRNYLILNVLDDVKNRLYVLTPGVWKPEPLKGAPTIGTVSISPVDDEESDDYFMTDSGYLTPSTLSHGSISTGPKKLKSTPAYFDASGYEVTQHFATSKDGTRVPYFMVGKQNLPRTSDNPTILYGYGGFEVSLTPGYSGSLGEWLENGGVYVVANIRGGGEYGPRWHQAALKENRLRAYEDFAAVAQDLFAQKVTQPKRLGIQGGSNGGLLVGNMLVLYPELFGAVVCEVPLLDMKRYSHLLAGASWMAEYGDPDTDDWSFIKSFSPYQNVKADTKYPPVLFMTSTRDDRVHPGHARKMMARMLEQGHDVTYYENIEGGHGGAADNKQAAMMRAYAWTFMTQRLMSK